MQIHSETIKLIELLDDPDSHLHDREFAGLKEIVIKNLTTVRHVDSLGDVYHQEVLS